jgi:hypothetical protein
MNAAFRNWQEKFVSAVKNVGSAILEVFTESERGP